MNKELQIYELNLTHSERKLLLEFISWTYSKGYDIKLYNNKK